jgi:site-specific recombinase XerD
MSKAVTRLNVLIELFLATKMAENKSAATLKWYRHMLTRYAAFLGQSATLKDVNLSTARAFVAHLQEQQSRYQNHPKMALKEGGLSPRSIQGYVRTMKVFASWLSEEEYTPINILARLKRPKAPDTLIQILTEEEIEALFDPKNLNRNCLLGNRMYTILKLLLDTGIRASELCSLKIENVNLQEDYIKVFGKGSKERVVTFGIDTKKALTRYLTNWRPESDYPEVFLDLKGKPLCYNNLVHSVANFGKRIGIPRLHPHLCRHTMAVNYLMEHKDLVTLRHLLGHTDVKTTEMYLKLTDAQIMINSKQSSLMDRIFVKPR